MSQFNGLFALGRAGLRRFVTSSRVKQPKLSADLSEEVPTGAAKLRRFLHVAVATGLYYSGALALRRWYRRTVLRKEEVCVLGLHRVLTKSERERSNSLDGMIILENTYLELLAHLQTRFELISLDDFLTFGGRKTADSKPLCMITFDDGWADTYFRAFPGLQKFGVPAVTFLTTGLLETNGGFWVEKLKKAWKMPRSREQVKTALRDHFRYSDGTNVDLETVVDILKHMPTSRREGVLRPILCCDDRSGDSGEVDIMLTWSQAKEMGAAGVEIGAHTVSHPLLTHEDKSTVECELKVSKQTIEAKLGKTVRSFAYPNGDWNESVRKAVAEAGYTCAFTTHPTWHARAENRHAISRVLLHEGNITTRDGKFSPAMLGLTLAGWA